jgi:PKD repeat protein
VSSGSYTVTLTVTDDQGASAQDTANLTVANRPPFANAGADRDATAGTTVTLDGSNSFDVDGSITSFRWTFGDGTAATNGVSVSHSYANAGTFPATLTVTDNEGATAQDTALVAVGSAPNLPPIANAGPDQSASVGAVVAFTGAGSSDPDGTIAAYNWAFGDGATAATASPSHVFAAAGNYAATLVVTDNSGATASDVVNITVSTTGSSTWARSIGTIGSDQATAVDTDATGNVYVTGTFAGSVTLGAFPLVSAGSADVFLAKYSPAGQVLWARRMGSLNAEQSYGFAVDAAGHVDIVGHYFDTADFGGPQPLVSTRTSGGGATQNLFIAQYATSDGSYQWAKSFGGPNTASANGVALDSSSNMYVTGFFTSTINFGGSVLSAPNASDRDTFVVKLTAVGGHIWSKHFTSNSTDQGVGVAVDGSGNVALVGYFMNGLNLGGSDMTAINSLTDIYVAKFDTNGTHIWSKKLGSDLGNEDSRGVAVDGSGNVVIVGVAISSVNFGGGLLSAGGYAYGYVAKYGAASGAYMWANRIGGPSGSGSANAVDVDLWGTVLVAGAFDSSTIDFVGGQQLARIGSTDGYVAKFTAAGALSWARAYGGASIDVLQTINAAPGGNPVTGGYLNGAATMEGTSLTLVGVSDAVLIRTSP